MTHCWLCGASEIKSPNSKYTYYGKILGKRVQKTIRVCNCCSAMRADEDTRRCPAFCPGSGTRRGCTRSALLCPGRACRFRPAGSHPHRRPRLRPGTGHGCPAG